MRAVPLLAFLLLSPLASNALAQMSGHGSSGTPTGAAVLMEGLGNARHPVSTKNPDAQKFFDQGLNLVYGFNHDEAIRSFRRAAELDPDLAMAHWGIAYSLGPNINLPADPERSAAAYAAAQQALALAPKAGAHERAYIEAVAKRYAADPRADRAPLDRAYREAMREVTTRYPDDLDAAALYAESILDLRPWAQWNKDGTPAEGTEELVAVLENVLRRDPDHMGAIHYYIHAVEAGPTPERAIGYASRLPALAPRAGHLVHMPTHLELNLGDYERAVAGNDVAAAADRDYIRTHDVTGVYPAMYFNHNLHMAAIASAMEGRYDEAMRWALELEGSAGPMLAAMPGIEFFVPTPLLVQIKFRRHADVLAFPRPVEAAPLSRVLWHYGRGLARLNAGKVKDAEREMAALAAEEKRIPADGTWGLNTAKAVAPIPRELLAGAIARAKKDPARAVAALERAVAAEDALSYNEPWDWYLFAREALGGELLRQKQFTAAEKAFRDELQRRPRSGRALFGLLQSLEAQGDTQARNASLVKAQYEKAWARAGSKLVAAEF